MRSTLLAGLALTALGAAPAPALWPPSPLGMPFDCPFTDGEVNIGALPFFEPPCVTVRSGSSVAWTNTDPFPVQHHAMSWDDQGRCFNASMSRGETESLTFYYDGIHASTRALGRTDCDGALNDLLSTPEAAVVSYTCPPHHTLGAYVVIEPA